MIDRAQIAQLIPHAGSMCLLDAVETWDERSISCTTRSHCDLENPLRNNHQLAALHLCEYGAQAMAVHGGLLAQRVRGGRAEPGLLASLREVEFAVDRVDDIKQTLTVAARKLVAGASGWLYEFEVSVDGRWLARGRVVVIHP